MNKHKSRRKSRDPSDDQHHHHHHHRDKRHDPQSHSKSDKDRRSYRSRSRSISINDHSSELNLPSTSSRNPRDTPERDETNLISFSFLDFKYELTKVLTGFTSRDKIVDDPKDFWLFVQKYERFLKSSGQSILPPPKDNDTANESTHSRTYDKSLNLNLKLAIPFSELYGRLSSYEQSSKITEMKLRQFLQIVVHYLDFRQKEKFMKLKKLRKSQANLPVAKYKTEIMTAVQNEKVILIAGDTG